MVNVAKGPFRWGIIFLLISAGLHLTAFLVGGLTWPAMILIPIALFYAVLATGLARGARWLGYLAYLCMLIGAVGALSNIWSAGPVPGWWYAAIAAADTAAVLAFGSVLWRAPHHGEPS